jgi:hypothetical protein
MLGLAFPPGLEIAPWPSFPGGFADGEAAARLTMTHDAHDALCHIAPCVCVRARNALYWEMRHGASCVMSAHRTVRGSLSRASSRLTS